MILIELTCKLSPQKKGTDMVGTFFLKHNFFKLFELILKKFYFQTFKIKAFSFCRNKFSEKEDYIQQQVLQIKLLKILSTTIKEG